MLAVKTEKTRFFKKRAYNGVPMGTPDGSYGFFRTRKTIAGFLFFVAGNIESGAKYLSILPSPSYCPGAS